MAGKRNLIQRLDSDGVICAEGFLFEMERRGYLAHGEAIPEVSLEYPEILAALHRDFQHAGSDVVEAFTYNGQRERLRVAGKEDLFEPMNRAALKIARSVADTPMDGGEKNLMAGNISNSNEWHPTDQTAQKKVRAMFDEMVGWAVDEGADFIIGETFYYAGEAYCALEAIQASGLPAVVTVAPMGENIMQDGVSIVDVCRHLEQKGADVVGMNCFRGPQTMMPYLKAIRQKVQCHMAALPIPYRTSEDAPTFFNLPDYSNCTCPAPHGRTFPTALDPLYCNRHEIRAFAEEALQLPIKYLGVCCGGAPMHIREVAEAMGRQPIASRYAPKMTNHFMYGDNDNLTDHITDLGEKA